MQEVFESDFRNLSIFEGRDDTESSGSKISVDEVLRSSSFRFLFIWRNAGIKILFDGMFLLFVCWLFIFDTFWITRRYLKVGKTLAPPTTVG